MKRYQTALLALCVLCALLLAGCGDKEPPQEVVPEPPAPPVIAETPPAAQPSAEDADVLYRVGGLDVRIPVEYKDLLIVETELEAWSEHWEPLLSLTERASAEAYERDEPGQENGMGWLCSITRLDRIGFEDWISGDETGTAIFAKDANDCYYVISQPTDVRFYRSGSGSNDPAEMEQWIKLNEWAQELSNDIVTINRLTPYDASDLLEADYTYSGEHVDLGYRFPGQPMDLVVLSLSQPVKQGEGGIWCVERTREVYSDYNFTHTSLVFPAALGFDETAKDYYARLQAEADAGQNTALLTPEGAVLDYAKRVPWLFGEDVSASDFEIVEALG